MHIAYLKIDHESCNSQYVLIQNSENTNLRICNPNPNLTTMDELKNEKYK